MHRSHDQARPGTVHGQFAAQAAATPGATAVVAQGGSLTYAELERRARALARRLRGLGVGPERLVAVLLERSPDLPAALLGTLAAGGAYLPLDPAQPPGRLAQLLAAARPAAVLAHRSLAPRLPPQRAPLLWADDPEDEQGARTPPPADSADGAAGLAGLAEVSAESLACVLYPGDPGGAVGHQRGVMVTHANLIDLFAAADRRLGAGAAGTWLALADVAHGSSVIELLWTLCRGFRVVLHATPRPVRGRADSPGAAAAAGRGLDFSLFYFGSYAAGTAADHYRLVLEGARFADRHGFAAVWTPERHFHEFGGLFPNPAVLSAAIATATERVQIRAGSVVMPLHHPLRVAEEWALADNLSHGRVGISFASGWHANDFVLNPGAYEKRHEIMRQGIETVRRLWRGEAVRLPSGAGSEVAVRIFPRPVQRELPVWVTAAGSPETFRLAGELGAGVLTHLLGQEADEFGEKIRIYREAWRQAGHGAGAGCVTVMLHTFVGATLEEVHAVVREPLCAYLKTSFGLLRSLAASIGVESDPRQLAPEELDLLVARAYERYVAAGAGLIGTPESCGETLARLRRLGVDEVACLIDFGVAADQVLASLPHLDRLRRESAQDGAPGPPAPAAISATAALAGQIARHGVTHLQCTPAQARALAADPAAAAALTGLRELLIAGEAPAPARRAVYLLDALLRQVPAGEPGEICIGGGGVARGYLGRADSTAERFVPDAWSGEPGARLFRTGDLARRRADQQIELVERPGRQLAAAHKT